MCAPQIRVEHINASPGDTLLPAHDTRKRDKTSEQCFPWWRWMARLSKTVLGAWREPSAKWLIGSATLTWHPSPFEKPPVRDLSRGGSISGTQHSGSAQLHNNGTLVTVPLQGKKQQWRRGCFCFLTTFSGGFKRKDFVFRASVRKQPKVASRYKEVRLIFCNLCSSDEETFQQPGFPRYYKLIRTCQGNISAGN